MISLLPSRQDRSDHSPSLRHRKADVNDNADVIDNADVNDSPLLVFPDAKYDAVDRKNKKRLNFGESPVEALDGFYNPDREKRAEILRDLVEKRNRLSLNKKNKTLNKKKK